MKTAFSLRVHYYQLLRFVRKMILILFHSLFLKVRATNFFFSNYIFNLILFHFNLPVHLIVPLKQVLIWLYFLFNHLRYSFMAMFVFDLLYFFMEYCSVLANLFFILLVGILSGFFVMIFIPDFIFMFASVISKNFIFCIFTFRG